MAISGTHFLCRQGAQERGIRFLFLITLNWPSGERAPPLDDVVDGGVGDILDKNGKGELLRYSDKECMEGGKK